MEIIYIDDHLAHFDGEHGKPGPDGRIRCWSLAAWLDDEAESYEEIGTPFDTLIGQFLRRAAVFARERGVMTVEAFPVDAFFQGRPSTSTVPVAE
jgi:hypothetical protein